MKTTQANLTNPVTGDEVPKVDNALAIGEDLEFQERWWKFESGIWMVFVLVLLADVLGVFGRGWLSKAKLTIPNSGMVVDYERVERASTPSVMRILPQPEAVKDGSMQLFVTETLVKELGAQRIIPQPERSIVGNGGITYTFPVSNKDSEIEFALQPSFPGVHTFVLKVPGLQAVNARVVVVP